MKKKEIYNDEIDLIDIFLVIKQNFLKIIFITLVPTILISIYLLNKSEDQILYDTRTEIEAISTFDLSEYKNYNLYANEIIVNDQTKKLNKSQIYFSNLNDDLNGEDYILFNKDYLLNLFLDKLKDREIFTQAIKKFSYINRENFNTEQEYDIAVKKLANKIKIVAKKNIQSKNSLMWGLEFESESVSKWESFLIFVEKETNDQVREYINQTFNSLIENQDRIKKFKIEDLKIEISNTKNDSNLKEQLLKNIELLIKDKKLKRLQDFFNLTPATDTNKFYAAKMAIYSTTYKNKAKILPKTKIVLSTAIFFFILGIIYTLISNSIKNRSKKYKS